MRRLEIAPVGDQTTAIRLSVRISSGGIGLDVVEDLIFVRAGRGIIVFSFSAAGAPFHRAFEAKLTRSVAGRLADDLGRSS